MAAAGNENTGEGITINSMSSLSLINMTNNDNFEDTALHAQEESHDHQPGGGRDNDPGERRGSGAGKAVAHAQHVKAEDQVGDPRDREGGLMGVIGNNQQRSSHR